MMTKQFPLTLEMLETAEDITARHEALVAQIDALDATDLLKESLHKQSEYLKKRHIALNSRLPGTGMDENIYGIQQEALGEVVKQLGSSQDHAPSDETQSLASIVAKIERIDPSNKDEKNALSETISRIAQTYERRIEGSSPRGGENIPELKQHKALMGHLAAGLREAPEKNPEKDGREKLPEKEVKRG